VRSVSPNSYKEVKTLADSNKLKQKADSLMQNNLQNKKNK